MTRTTATRVAAFLLAAASAPAFAAPSPAGLGKEIFRDTSLSSSGRMACSTCHDPAKAHAQDNDLAVQSGGAELATPGFRAVPSLRYMNMNSPFFFASDGTPTGGFARDVNMSEAPYNRRPGQPPALKGAEIDDAVAFLKTLTDGYDPITDTADPARDVPKDQ